MAEKRSSNMTDDDELAYWREQYTREPYYQPHHSFEYYEAAYRVGWQGRSRYGGRSFEDAEPELREEYERTRGNSPLTWEQSRNAVRAAWRRLDRVFPDSD